MEETYDEPDVNDIGTYNRITDEIMIDPDLEGKREE